MFVYAWAASGCYGTKFTTVDLICKNDVMDAILDKFGKDVTTYCYDMENFRAEVDVVPSSVFYSWVFGFGGDVVINGPANVKEEYKQLVQSGGKATVYALWRPAG